MAPIVGTRVCPKEWLHEATSGFTKLLFCNVSPCLRWPSARRQRCGCCPWVSAGCHERRGSQVEPPSRYTISFDLLLHHLETNFRWPCLQMLLLAATAVQVQGSGVSVAGRRPGVQQV